MKTEYFTLLLFLVLSGCGTTGRMATGWGRDYEPENRTEGSGTRDRTTDSKTNPTPENTRRIITGVPVYRALESDEIVLESILRQELDDWKGVPYVLGGLTMSGIDCSGLVQRIFANALNVQTPRTTKELLSFGKRVNRSSLRSGDLVFFEPRSSLRHVGIYLSEGLFAHASSSSGVMISALSEPYWARSYTTSRRILGSSEVLSKAVSYGKRMSRIRTDLQGKVP